MSNVGICSLSTQPRNAKLGGPSPRYERMIGLRRVATLDGLPIPSRKSPSNG